MAGDKFWHCLLSNIWPLIGQTGPYSGFAFYWLWDHIFDFIGRQAEIDFGRIYEVALLFSTFPPITDNPDSEISWSQPMRWGKISRQECGVYLVLWALSWQDGADLVCIFFCWRAGKGVRRGVQRASYVLEVRCHLGQEGQLMLLPVRVAGFLAQ